MSLESHPETPYGLEAFGGGAALPDGRVVFAPGRFHKVGVFDPSKRHGDVSEAFKLYPETETLSQRYGQSVLGTPYELFVAPVAIPDGRVVFAPDNSVHAGVFDPSTNEFTLLTAIAASGAKPHFRGAALAGDGKVVMCPTSYPAVWTFDPGTDALESLPLPAMTDGVTDQRWKGAAAMLDGRVVCTPHKTGWVLMYDGGASPKLSLVGPTQTTGTQRHDGAATLADGRVLFAPFSAPDSLLLNPSTLALTHEASLTPPGSNYHGVLQGLDGRLVFVAGMHQATHVLDFSSGGAVSPSETISHWDDPSVDVNKQYSWSGAVRVGSLIVFVPLRAKGVGVLSGLGEICAENHRALGGACAPCPGARLRPAGDLPADGDTECQCPAGTFPHANATLDDGAACFAPCGVGARGGRGTKSGGCADGNPLLVGGACAPDCEPGWRAASDARCERADDDSGDAKTTFTPGTCRSPCRSFLCLPGQEGEEGARAKVARLRGVDL